MLARLNKPLRLKAGWCIALAYLFCVLAPGVSFAFADSARSAPCIIEDHGPGMQMHGAAGQHVHDAGAVHDHIHGATLGATLGASMAHEGMTAHEHHGPSSDPHKSTDTRCCGLISLSALPAGETVLVEPLVLASRCATEGTRLLTDNAPPTHYRPPIS